MRKATELGGKIRQIRGKATQKDFAAALDISQGSIAKYETGKAAPGASTLLAIAKLGGVTVESLLSENCAKGEGNEDVNGKSEVLSDDEHRLIMAARELIKSEPELWETIFNLTIRLAGLKDGKAPRTPRGRSK